jgi:hypothetical protein
MLFVVCANSHIARNVVQGFGVRRLKPALTSLTMLRQTWKSEGKIVSRARVHRKTVLRISI